MNSTNNMLRDATADEIRAIMRRANEGGQPEVIGACRAELNRRMGVVTTPAPALRR